MTTKKKNTISNIGIFLFMIFLGFLMYSQRAKNHTFSKKEMSSITKFSFENKVSIR